MHDDDVSDIRICNILNIKMFEQSFFVSGFRLFIFKKCFRVTHSPQHCLMSRIYHYLSVIIFGGIEDITRLC